ncbi:thioredoxin [Podila verticillata NRRL 6337]|nr:MAG: thioredoxin-like protein [Podila humilis]KFH65849.1 thioredoxin [Podila verticillata NRRL 6337]
MNSLRLLSRSVQQVGRINTQARFFQSSSFALTGKTHDASDNTFKALVGVKEPVLVDFHADWCGPCRLIDPILREAVSGSGEVTLVRVNVDDCPEVSSKFQIASIPCVMAFKNGEPVEKFVGAIPKKNIQDFVTRHAARA